MITISIASLIEQLYYRLLCIHICKQNESVNNEDVVEVILKVLFQLILYALFLGLFFESP